MRRNGPVPTAYHVLETMGDAEASLLNHAFEVSLANGPGGPAERDLSKLGLLVSSVPGADCGGSNAHAAAMQEASKRRLLQLIAMLREAGHGGLALRYTLAHQMVEEHKPVDMLKEMLAQGDSASVGEALSFLQNTKLVKTFDLDQLGTPVALLRQAVATNALIQPCSRFILRHAPVEAAASGDEGAGKLVEGLVELFRNQGMVAEAINLQLKCGLRLDGKPAAAPELREELQTKSLLSTLIERAHQGAIDIY
eukprot:SAG31_NODE_421_length_15868_cov_8.966453_17_plen_253_part_00